MTTSIDSPSTRKRSSAVKVLIVDDSIHDFRSLSLMIGNNSDNDYEFEWARNSEEAELKLQDGDFEIVAMDYNLGLEEGSEVIGRLSPRFPGSSFILVTGNQDPEVYKRGIQAGAVNFVQKNNDSGVIFDRMAQYALERKKGETSLKVANASKDWLMSLLETDLASPLFALNKLLSSAVKDADYMPKEMLVELIDTAYQSSCEALMATKQMMEWGRSIKGAVAPKLKMIDVAAGVDSAVRLLTTVADEKGVYISQRGIYDLKAFSDERVIGTVMRNLLSAALMYSSEDSKISIVAENRGPNCRIAFLSEGRGIDSGDFASLCNREFAENHVWKAEDRQATCAIQVASHMLDSIGVSLELKNVQRTSVCFSFELPSKAAIGI
ncbi:response regulator [Pelagicoccus albus]|uniref:Response regulator n=1 Tax=Pelagicoccus albus TaxID=415222 RepID=A0A7X1B2M1_9BACT|nr:response regulator [Pelagicoccus albus]MBC2604501.1 response regulator [Pelagicoccus albus]